MSDKFKLKYGYTNVILYFTLFLCMLFLNFTMPAFEPFSLALFVAMLVCGQQKPKIFKASKTALFKAGRMVGLLNEDETLALNVTTGDTELATIPIRMEEEGEEITYILQIKPESKGVKLKVTDDLAKFTVMIKCSAQITDASKAKSVEDITRSQIVQKKVLDAAEKQITETLSDVYTKSMESGCDVYGVQQSLYRHNYKYYEKMKDDILQAVHPEYSVKLHTLR